MRFVALWLCFSGVGAIAAAPELFLKHCALCHGADATGSDRGPSLVGLGRQRVRAGNELHDLIQRGTQGGMPAFNLPESELALLTGYLRSLNSTAYGGPIAGDVEAGRQFFFGDGKCSSCHMVEGRGKANGPDLSTIARQLSLGELEQALREPSARIAPGYWVVDVTLKGGGAVRGFARSQGQHDVQVQMFDGRIRSFLDSEYVSVAREPKSLMPALDKTSVNYGNVLAYLTRLGGTGQGVASVGGAEQVLHPAAGDWPTYHRRVSGNRFSSLGQIDRGNVAQLKQAWSYTIPYFGLEMTPLVVDGQMIVTGPNQVYSIDARTGRENWKWVRARTSSGVAGDAIKGANRGAAIQGDSVFYSTDNAHLICLNRLTGALIWDVPIAEGSKQPYGATAAPLVAGDLVIAGVAGADEGIRGFLAAYHADTGKPAWRFWTVPKPGEKGSETWGDPAALDVGGGSTWLTGTYDPETGVLYWPTGNPYPDTDGEVRKGDNLYTNCILALELKTGKLLWHYQYTPHDVHDWDAVQPPVLVDAVYRGRPRKLLMQANRSGIFYVLDRTNGEVLLAKPFVKKLTWASGVGADGRPVLLPNNDVVPDRKTTCPAVRGATNWYSTAFNPDTRLFYLMVVEDCGTYWRSPTGGFGFNNDIMHPGFKALRALNIESGEIVWEIPQSGPVESNYSGVLSTAGGLVFFGETGGAFAAVDSRSGKVLWHFDANQPWKASPMTYEVNGTQYVAIASGSSVLAFSLGR